MSASEMCVRLVQSVVKCLEEGQAHSLQESWQADKKDIRTSTGNLEQEVEQGWGKMGKGGTGFGQNKE